MKYIKNTLTIIALCAALTTNAKQVGSKATAQPQPKPTPTPYVQPTPKPMPKPTTYYPQPQTGPTYSEILSSLKQKTPDSSDFSTLKNIEYEAKRQMELIQKSVEKDTQQDLQGLLAQTENPAKRIFKKYPINFNKTQQQINDASKNDTDIFTGEEQNTMIEALFYVVKELSGEFSTLSSQQIYDIITAHHPEFKTFQAKLNAKQRKDVNEFLKMAVDIAYGMAKKS